MLASNVRLVCSQIFRGLVGSSRILPPDTRRFRFQSHHIFYTEEADYVLIRALYHHARRIKPALFDCCRQCGRPTDGVAGKQAAWQ